MQKFQELLTEAAQLKQQQLKQQRKNFQALPQYLKSGLNYAKKYVQLRKQHYLIQKYISQNLKKQGNDQYQLQNYSQALNKYQQALSVFRYIHATKYENLKDEDIIYQNYTPNVQYQQEHNNHLVALYLNICSALTKMNKKDQAIHSSEEALKINSQNPKIYYKKAQAYLQYINRETSDIKVGFYYLNKAYQLSKDQSILVQMHKIKKQLDQERQKQKKWFKFMFDKNKQNKQQSINFKEETSNNNQKLNTNSSLQKKQNEKVLQQNPQKKQVKQRKEKQNKTDSKNQMLSQDIKKLMTDVENLEDIQSRSLEDIQQKASHFNKSNINNHQKQIKNKKIKEQFQKFRQQNQQKKFKHNSQVQKLQKTKLQLKAYLIVPRDDRWLIKYQEDFIHKHGSKIYSILQLYNYSEYLLQFKALLAKCLELKIAKITIQRDEQKLLDQKISMYNKFIEWMKKHPIDKYRKYIERYDLQTEWIKNNRGKPLDQVFSKSQGLQQNKKPSQKVFDRRAQKNQLEENKFDRKQMKTNYPKKQSKERLQQFMNSVRQSSQNARELGKNHEQEEQKQFIKQKNSSMKNQKKTQKQQMSAKKLLTQTKSKQKVASEAKKQKENKKYNTYGFKQQWQCSNEFQQERPNFNNNKSDQVPAHLKAYLQNYQDFPGYNEKIRQQQQMKIKDQHKTIRKGKAYDSANMVQKSATNEQAQEQIYKVKQNPFGFIKTFAIIVIFTLIAKILF